MQRMQIWYINNERQWEERRQQPTCPFCRHPIPETEEEFNQNLMKRVEANDPNSISRLGYRHLNEGNYDGAFKCFAKAVELGDTSAHYHLSIMYQDGEGVEKDEKKELYHLEEAAIAGHPSARNNLGCHEGRNGRIERAVKHLIIAANLGHENAMKTLKECYKDGDVSKEDFAAALLAHHAAVTAMKSPQREEAANF